MKRQLLPRGLTIALCLCLLAWAQMVWPQENYPNAHLLASVEWLQAHLTDPTVRIVDLRRQDEYDAGHIPGAVYLNLGRIRATVNGVPGMVAPPQQLADVFGSLGIGNQTTVVAYDDTGGLYAARLFWTLEYVGHRKVRILNRGYRGWMASGGAVSTTVSSYAARSFEVRLDPARVISADEIQQRLGHQEVALVDTRHEAEYTGEVQLAKRGGHIPGAKHVAWFRTLDVESSGWLPPQELVRLYESQGITQDKEVIPYCQTYLRAAHTYFTLRLLGYDKVRGYDGSWAEWGNRPELPAKP